MKASFTQVTFIFQPLQINASLVMLSYNRCVDDEARTVPTILSRFILSVYMQCRF